MKAPLVLVPGIQGRYEYMKPAIDALSECFQVRTFSLRRSAVTLDDYAHQITESLDQDGVERAVVCGVSFGGLVAIRFAATEPQRARALVLASTPAPGMKLRPRHRLYVRLPWLFGPLFLMETPWRLRAEMAAALPDRRERTAFRLFALRTLRQAPISVSDMARRAILMASLDLERDCANVTAPTLVVTGERALDHVVPVDASYAYARLIRGAQETVIERTGHLGTVTRPAVFADLVRTFIEGLRDAAA
jgi:pimeloyl-ACP methyl ester carboxylesterase